MFLFLWYSSFFSCFYLGSYKYTVQFMSTLKSVTALWLSDSCAAICNTYQMGDNVIRINNDSIS